jgi:hypothetical protein
VSEKNLGEKELQLTKVRYSFFEKKSCGFYCQSENEIQHASARHQRHPMLGVKDGGDECKIYRGRGIGFCH